MDEQKPQAASEGSIGQSASTGGLDANALNDAGWAFIDAWNLHTKQKMSGDTWNNIKPMVAAAIRKYLQSRLPATNHSARECSEAFEWLRAEATRDGAPPQAGVALDEWHALSKAVASNDRVEGAAGGLPPEAPARTEGQKA